MFQTRRPADIPALYRRDADVEIACHIAPVVAPRRRREDDAACAPIDASCRLGSPGGRRWRHSRHLYNRRIAREGRETVNPISSPPEICTGSARPMSKPR